MRLGSKSACRVGSESSPAPWRLVVFCVGALSVVSVVSVVGVVSVVSVVGVVSVVSVVSECRECREWFEFNMVALLGRCKWWCDDGSHCSLVLVFVRYPCRSGESQSVSCSVCDIWMRT